MTDEVRCLQLEGKKTCPGDPVRIEGRQGLWRFIAIRPGPIEEMVEVVGPFKGAGSQEIARFFGISKVKRARGATRLDVAGNQELKTWKR